METYNSKGAMMFRLSKDGIETQTFDRHYYLDYWRTINKDMAEDMVNQHYEVRHKHDIYNLIDGETFLKDVKDKCLMDYDGYISNVFVNGFDSNLGLATDEMTSGSFLVDEEVWKDICSKYKVEVNWVNK